MMAPPIPYYGGKRNLAHWIISMMPAHDCYVEPFFGAGAVLFAKHPIRREVINDRDGMAVAFFRMLRDAPDHLADVCRMTPYARDEFRACRTGYDDTEVSDIEKARRFFAVVTQSYNSTTGSAEGWALGSGESARHRAHAVHDMIDRFHLVASRLNRVLIDNTPAVEVIKRYGHEGGMIYCDPPYVHGTRGDTDTGHGYRHEMTDDDHIELARALHDTDANVFLSGYRCDLYHDLYGDWWSTEITTTTTVANPNAKNHQGNHRTEVVWSNAPINDGRLPL